MRKIVVCDRGVRAGRWTARDDFLSSDVHGKTLGIFGFGRIGKAVTARALGFNMTVLVHDPYVDGTTVEHCGARAVGREELLGHADIITLHTPLTAETRGMINAETIGRMKDGVVLINTARGDVVDEPALIAALKTGKIAGAGLDVVAAEPLALDHPYLVVLAAPAVHRDLHVPHVRLGEAAAGGAARRRWRSGCSASPRCGRRGC
jgi:D-3-phosphoglycerate dehydrogenase